MTAKMDETEVFVHFFDLPQEIRDQIYSYWPKVAWIDVTQTHPAIHAKDRSKDKSVCQPTTSRVCRQMRTESLDVFYGKNKFLIDLRGWKHSEYPHHWTPLKIFSEWLTAIGDENAARLRSLSFWSHNFAAHVKVSTEKPQLSLKFRTAKTNPELAENVCQPYNFKIAGERAAKALKLVLTNIENSTGGGPLTANDLIKICKFVENLQPFMCKRQNLGFRGVVLPEDLSRRFLPDCDAHRDKCDDCGYHRKLEAMGRDGSDDIVLESGHQYPTQKPALENDFWEGVNRNL